MSVAREGLVVQRQNFPITMIIAGILVPCVEYLLGAGLPVNLLCALSRAVPCLSPTGSDSPDLRLQGPLREVLSPFPSTAGKWQSRDLNPRMVDFKSGFLATEPQSCSPIATMLVRGSCPPAVKAWPF